MYRVYAEHRHHLDLDGAFWDRAVHIYSELPATDDSSQSAARRQCDFGLPSGARRGGSGAGAAPGSGARTLIVPK
jgi:hypothetical protein